MHILKINSGLERAIQDGKDIAGRTSAVGPSWDVLQSLHALMINSGVNLNAFPSQFRIKDTPRQSLVQRLKGKQGRFRQNLQGKRVNFTARSVISPDPNLRIDQVGIPIDVAKKLTFAEQVTRYNINQMKNLVKNGGEYPGANEILYKNGEKCNLTFLREKRRRDEKSKELRIGDTIHRHLHDGDIVLFNRQPSLHRQSMMSHQVKVMPWKTFRFNECVCAPYNADFDGDEMNVHLPQTNEARSEAMVLMGVKSNTLTCRSGEPLVASIQDFITSMYLLTQKDVFFTHQEFLRLITTVTARNRGRLRIPPPCILRPTPLWTGKQVFSCLLRPNPDSDQLINLSSKAKRFEAPAEISKGKWVWRGTECVGFSKNSPEMICNDSWVLIRNSELVAGTMDKNSLGSGSKKQVFYMLTRDYGEEAAAQAMWRMCRIGPRFLSNRGFSIGIGDVWASENLLDKKMKVIGEQYRKVDEHILAKKHNKLKLQPGCTADETLENIVQKELSKIRDDAAKACFAELSKFNTPLNMALCGSKGSNINIAQMVACVGQQVLSGSRIPNGFEARSLPHFERDSKDPKSRGFVQNSFFSGLTPTEFFFHTMGGREGLVDTAVKTASTGYMQRRLVKALEGLCVQYDGTVRNTDDRVIQFTYGEDQLDPQEMEGDSRPVDFDRVWTDSICRFGSQSDRALCSDEIKDLVREAVEKVKKDKRFKYNDEGFGVGFRNFLDNTTIEFADKQADIVKSHWESYGVYAKSDEERARYQALRTTAKQVKLFVERCALKYFKARMEPGTCVGAICATSIGEPATQMTLKTFHFAGVASMNITQGVPRIEQIINNTQKIKTPIIMAKLTTEDSKEFAQEVASKLEKTTLGEICEFIQEVHNADESFLLLKLDTKRVRLLKMRVTVESIKHSIAISSLKLKLGQIIAHGESILTIHSSSYNDSGTEWQMSLPNLKDSICAVLVQGLKEINRAVISHQDKKEGFYEMIIDGNDLGGVLATRGIDWSRTSSNHIPKVFEILGVEAARSTIINEMTNTMGHHGIHVDRRHLMMLADYMTYTGPVFGCTRIGLANVSNSPLHLSSFEKTSDILYNAAYYGQRDSLAGPSAALILGVPIELGTGLFKLYQETKLDKEKVKKKETLFDHFTQNSSIAVGT